MRFESKFYLIGFMASGKSTLGNKAADNLGYSFSDTDDMIEQKTLMSINDMFNTYGQEYFRWIEAQILRKHQMTDMSICALGGGAPLFYNTMSHLKQTGTTIFLDLNFDIILERLKNQVIRPLVRDFNEKEISDLYNARVALYNTSDIRLKMTGNLKEDTQLLTQVIKDP